MLTQMKQWMTPPYFESDEDKTNQTRILSTIIGALWGGYLFVVATAFYYQDWPLITVTLTGCTLLILPLLLLKRGRLHASGLLVVLNSIGTVTLIATVGQGIRDLAIVAYPMIFIFAGLTLSREFFRISVGLALLAICWLALGEINGWFVTKPFDGEMANWFYLITAAILLLIAALAVDLLTVNMRRNLDLAQQEIARRQQADAYVRASEARFRAVVEHNCNGVVFLSAERKINYASPAYIQLLGFTPEELIGHFGAEYIYAEDQKRADQDFAELLQTSGQPRITRYRLRHKDGSAVWVEATSANLLGDPHVQAIVLSHHDINKRKLVEEEMQKNQKRFHALIEHGRDNISMLSADGILLWESPSAETVLGYPTNAFMGHSIFELVHPDDQTQARQIYTQVLQSPKIIQAGESRLQHADGTWRWLEYSATNLLDEPSVQAIVLNYRDITPRKQADVEMRETRDQMQVAQEMGQTGSWVYYLETQKIWATANTRRIFGYAALAGDFPIDEIESCIPERERVHGALLSLISEERPYDLEYIIHPADGAAPKTIHAIAKIEKDAQGNPLKVHGFIQDITERKQADAKNLMQTIALETAANGIVITNKNGSIEWVNPAWSAQTGYSKEEAIGQNHRILKSEKHPDGFYKNLWQTILAGKTWRGEIINKRKDGTLYNQDETITPVLNEHGEVSHFISIQQDITARKQAELAHRESEKRLRQVIDLVPHFIFAKDINGKFILANTAIANAYGTTVKNLIGKMDADFNPNTDEVEHFRSEDQSVIKNGISKTIEETLTDSKGQKIILETTKIPFTASGSKLPAILGVSVDITKRKQAKAALRESEEKYRGLIQNSPDAIAIYIDGKIVFANTASVELMHANNVNELLGRPITEVIHPDYQEFVAKRMLTMQKSGKALPPAEEKLIRLDGSAVDVEVKALPILFDQKPAVQVIVRDITERKQHKNELEAIAALSAALRSAPTRADVLPVITRQLVSLLNCETVSIEIIDPLTGDTTTEAAHGTWKDMIGVKQKNGTGINAIIRQTRQPYHSNDWKNDPNLTYPEWARGDINSGAGAPLIAQDKLIGFVWMGCKTSFSKSEVRLLAAVADIAASAIHRATLHEQAKKDAAELALAYDTTLEGWAHALELRDQETEGHTRRVTELTIYLARAMGIEGTQLENIRRGALLHDIGKMGIPDAILRKPGKLDQHEWEIMKQHPEYAYKLLAPIEYLRPVLDIPYCHHERWDGTGYPRNLKGEEIPLVARIFSIVDVWDALTSDRPYRKAWDREKALAHIAEQSRKHFDPAVVDAFMKIDSHPNLLR